MSKIHILLTFDYEIFGNGTGDIRGCLVNPTEKILQLLQKYNAKATFFVDVCLIWALQDRYNSAAFQKLDYDPLSLIEDQLSAILSEGHDVQLHAHPQLINARYNGFSFDVNYNYWRIIDLPYDSNLPGDKDHGGPYIKNIISEGKDTLTELCRRTILEYEVVAFRAGGLCSRPEKMLLMSLRENGIPFDFSASYNFQSDSWPGIVEYTDVFKKPDPVPVGETYNDQRQSSDLILFPIYGALYHYYRSELGSRLLNKIKKDESRWSWKKTRPEGANGNTSIPGFQPKPQERKTFMSRLKPITINFYLENSLHDMIWCAKDAVRRYKRGEKDIYMVGLGHPKAMGDLSQLELFFQWIQAHKSRDIFRFLIVRGLLDHQIADAHFYKPQTIVANKNY